MSARLTRETATRKNASEMANKALVAEKVGMTQVWRDDSVVPVTVLRVAPLRVVQVKTPERDGYGALQVTWGDKDPSKMPRPLVGHYEAAGVGPGKKLVELRLEDVSEYQPGEVITAADLQGISKVDVTAVSRGKGFAGVMKRHNFAGQPASHGAHAIHRTPGAVGACATPARIFPGKPMPGRMGAEKVTTLNLEVVEVDPDAEIVLVGGSVPGPKGGRVIVRTAVQHPASAQAGKGDE